MASVRSGKSEDDFVVHLPGIQDSSSSWSVADHKISGYVAALRSRIEPKAVQPNDAPPVDERVERWVEAYLHELRPADFEVVEIDDLPPAAQSFFSKQSESNDVTTRIYAQRTQIDGETAFIIRNDVNEMAAEGRRREVAFLFDDRSLVAAPGREVGPGGEERTFALPIELEE